VSAASARQARDHRVGAGQSRVRQHDRGCAEEGRSRSRVPPSPERDRGHAHHAAHRPGDVVQAGRLVALMSDAVGDRATHVARPAMAPLVRLLRPRQWIKNGFVLAPLIFSGEFNKPSAVIQEFVAFALFCIASSATYVVNDLKDREADAAHPVKSRKRPLASGEVKPGAAIALVAFLYAIILASFLWNWQTAAVASGYVALNLAYSLRLKHIPVIDIFCLAAGFVLRVYGGAVAID